MVAHINKTIRLIIKPVIIVAILCALAVACKSIVTIDEKGNVVLGQRPEPAETGEDMSAYDFQFENPDVTPFTNIHYTGKYCNECHEQTPMEGSGTRYLKFNGDYGRLCRCHDVTPGTYVHPVDIIPSPEKKKRMPDNFPLENGRLSCLTCHNIYLQCQKSLFVRNSVRGAPYPKRTDFCFQCHDRKNFKQQDPHLQLNKNGEILIETCLVCHTEKPDEKHATFADVTFIGDIEMMCRRCHHIAGNHSGNADHMGILPSADGLRRIRAMEEKYTVRLPLDENGKMTCITCHNPHARGVLPSDSPGAKGADSKYRHRLPENLCRECHQM